MSTATITLTTSTTAATHILQLHGMTQSELLAKIETLRLDERERSAFETAKPYIEKETTKAYALIIGRVLQGAIARRGIKASPELFECERAAMNLLQKELPPGESAERYVENFKLAREAIRDVEGRANAIAAVFETRLKEIYTEAEILRSEIEDDRTKTNAAFVELQARRKSKIEELDATFHSLREGATNQLAKAGALAKGAIETIEKAQTASARYGAIATSVTDIKITGK